MTEKNKTSAKQKPEHVVRCGEISAIIHLRQSNAGYPYRDFSLVRTWTSMTTTTEARGSTFFDRNARDLIEAIEAATAWIRQRSQPSPSDVNATNPDDAVR